MCVVFPDTHGHKPDLLTCAQSLSSNPEGDYNKAVNDKFSKTQKPSDASN